MPALPNDLSEGFCLIFVNLALSYEISAQLVSLRWTDLRLLVET